MDNRTLSPHNDDAAGPAPDAPIARVADVSRRGLLGGVGALAGAQLLCPMSAAAAPAPTVPASTPGGAAAAAKAAKKAKKLWKHSVEQRGLDVAVRLGRSQEGRFGVMFKKLDAYGPPDPLLEELAASMIETDLDPTAFDNPKILAGFTFLGQFIDHDMTLDKTPMPDVEVDPHGVRNFDSPDFDLASLYGRGPAKDPEFYEGKKMKLVTNVHGALDLPRDADGVALIGDGRNDENLIVAQLHILFAKFHNRCLEEKLAKTLAEAQWLTRWHFQWLIVHDYLPQVVGQPTVDRFLRYNGSGKPKVDREYYKPKNPNKPMMPIEYSVAAFRFGHSMVRAGYFMGAGGGGLTFGPEGSDLRGSRPLPKTLEIEWQRFYDVPGATVNPPGRNLTHRIDGKLSFPLFNLPPTVVSDAMVSLAQRNLIRGKRLGLPSGQAVAKAMGITPLSNSQLELPSPNDAGWAGQAPLWYYILKESEIREGGLRLGPVGGRIVAEVILGILDVGKTSYFNVNKSFEPEKPIAPSKGKFLMGDFVNFATGK